MDRSRIWMDILYHPAVDDYVQGARTLFLDHTFIIRLFLAFFLTFCFIFYLNTFVLIPQLYLKQKYLIYAGIFLTGFILIFYTQPFENLIFKKFHTIELQRPDMDREMFRPPPPPDMDFEDHGRAATRGGGPTGDGTNGTAVDFVSLVLFVVVWAVALATRISEQWRLSEKRVILSEADKAQAELSFFKAQINPHFLFNTLNNIYSLAISNSEHTAPSILKLSKMMRYITEEATENFVPLEDEIICLENYVDLQRLRLNAKTKVDFNVKGSFVNKKIAPLILMTFVENAFKYGVSNRYENLIEINVDVTEKTILFFCKNTIFQTNVQNERKGIGIANTQKRLDFLYPNRYEFKINQQEKIFEVNLELQTEG
ncbi:sensor histidine kinase [Dyadobacter sp. NIV53]|uniref:sensor histidine kinase n=1 Tax=Dyadobacter sp. NIV53 TaxID=2861765 RepID=UPI001C852730|nr:sensor histidine kinase [Dyadobacter sp. NIV53]